jgi:N-acetylmuramoyl-L-alanine amidase
VGNVVLNRVHSDEFPDTIYDVIFDSRWGGQFQPVSNGTIYDDPTEESVVAAKLCLEGANTAGASLYFLAPALTQNHWIMDNQTYVTTIGCHWFYR